MVEGLISDYEAKHPGVKVRLVFDSIRELRQSAHRALRRPEPARYRASADAKFRAASRASNGWSRSTILLKASDIRVQMVEDAERR